nr:MAG TPA: hypothetical protein [Caudoviricetes sp.]
MPFVIVRIMVTPIISTSISRLTYSDSYTVLIYNESISYLFSFYPKSFY